MARVLGWLFALVLIWYVLLTFGCITAHHLDDASLENPPSNEELKETMRAVECLVPQPTFRGMALAVLVTMAAGYLGLRQ